MLWSSHTRWGVGRDLFEASLTPTQMCGETARTQDLLVQWGVHWEILFGAMLCQSKKPASCLLFLRTMFSFSHYRSCSSTIYMMSHIDNSPGHVCMTFLHGTVFSCHAYCYIFRDGNGLFFCVTGVAFISYWCAWLKYVSAFVLVFYLFFGLLICLWLFVDVVACARWKWFCWFTCLQGGFGQRICCL